MDGDNKGRILFLEHYFLNHTDQDHPITTDKLIDVINEHRYSANRNTIRDDIKALRDEGIRIADVRIGNGKGYYNQDRPFTIPELKALIDSVSSSQFIPERKSREMIRQLIDIAPEMYRKDLKATAYCTNRIKTGNTVAFQALDEVNRALAKHRQISFQYADYLLTKEEVLRHNGKVYVVSPLALIWNDGRYYVPSYNAEKDKIVPYRIDRMRNVKTLIEAAVEKKFDPAEFSRKVLWMYDGDQGEEDIILIAENRHMISLIDRFGTEFPVWKTDENHFRAIIKAIPSYTFFSWIFQFCGGIRIDGPGRVKKNYEEMLRIVTEKQQ